MVFLEIVFWMSVGLVAYAYLGYALVLWGLSLFRCRRVSKADITPPVTFIITAYNEQSRIAGKLENTLKLTYPVSRLKVVVASDCSSDRTDEIVKSYADQGIQLVRASVRKGKEAAQKLAVEVAKGEIFVFSDVATILPEHAVSNIVKNFNDPTVGCVSSVDRFVDQDGQASGEGAYVRYEMFLRSLETRVNSLVGLSGSFWEVCQNWKEDLQSDFNTLLNSVVRGLRGVSDPDSEGFYKNLTDEKKEYERKVRTILRGISVVARRREMLNPFRYGLFAWQLFSHKVCRWLVPFALLGALISALGLARYSGVYLVFFGLQACFYAMAIIGLVFAVSKPSFIKLSLFFVLVNISILHAWIRFARGKRVVAWESSKR